VAEVFARIQSALDRGIDSSEISHGTLVLRLTRDRLLGCVARLKNEFGFDMLLDVTAVDWPEDEERFDVVWHLYSTQHFVRIRIKTRVTEADPAVPTLCPLFGSANFMERECREMYGIVFDGHADPRPLLLYEGFVGHPLRKDYAKDHEQPLVAYRTPAPDA